MAPRSRLSGIRLICFAWVLGCSGCDTNAPDTFVVTYAPPFDPSRFVTGVTNPHFPLPEGLELRYESDTDEGLETITVEVLAQRRVVAGVEATVVRDRVFLAGSLIEDTFDWYAQDVDGNVWYLGEDSKEYKNGQLVGSSGSWETGVDGALAGILMPAEPAVGQAYRQEYYRGEAEDRGRVLSVGETVTVPAGTFSDCVKTEDTTPLERDALEHKYHCAGVGTVLEVDVEGGERVELIYVTLP